MSTTAIPGFAWLPTGRDGLEAMLAAVDGARQSVGMEVYTWKAGELGDRFRSALVSAAKRGVRVRLLVDSFGSFELPATYFAELIAAGGNCRWFNPLELGRLTYRDHRKLLVIDDEVAFVTGFNVGEMYFGDGIETGWRDAGMKVAGSMVAALAQGFHGMFGAASFRHRRLSRFRRHFQPQRIDTPEGSVFLITPGRGRNPMREALTKDLLTARQVQLTTAYFLPPRRFRMAMQAAARRGVKVQLLLPGCCDVRLAQLAARGLYSRLMRAGIEVYEYLPAMLHLKRYVVDDSVYVGSSNLDMRSFNVNYELMVRVDDPQLAEEGRLAFADDLKRSKRILPREWGRRPWYERLLERFAATILIRVDLRISLHQLRQLRSRGLRDLATAPS